VLGVPPGAYSNGKDFRRFVIEPAMLEVNGLSDIGMKIEMKRRHARAPIEAITVVWWKKEGDEIRATMRERDHSKIGRMARLKGAVETVTPQAIRLSES
jgi:hypothetical protein